MKLPVLSGKDVIKVLIRAGYAIRNQRGSHVHLCHPSRPSLTVPNHREIARGTLRAIISASGIPPEEFLR